MPMGDESIAPKAKIVIDQITPTTGRTDADVFAIRYAAGTARDAIKNFSSEASLDVARGEAATALGVCAA